MLWPFRVLHSVALNAASSGLSFSTPFLPFIFFCCFCGWQTSAVCEGHQFGRCLPLKHQVLEAGCQGGARLKEAGVPMQRRARERSRCRQREREWEQEHSESCWEQWFIRSALTAETLSLSLSSTPALSPCTGFHPHNILSVLLNAYFSWLFFNFLKSTCLDPHLDHHVHWV